MKKSLVLAAAIAALSAIAVPSMASAATWTPLNTVHTLTSPSSITFDLGSGTGISCSSGPRFTAQVRTPASALMDLTSTSTLSCTGYGSWSGPIPVALTGLPLWNADGTSGASNVKINAVNIELTYTGIPFTITGTLAGGVWSNLTRSLAFSNDTGLVLKGGSAPPAGAPVTVTASEFIKDTTSPFVGL